MNSKEEVLDNLVVADEYIPKVFPELNRLELVITGGASFLLKGFKNKMTYDIDTISALRESHLEYLESFSITGGASEVTKIPHSYRERLIRLNSGCKVLDIYVPSNEDLVLSKIGRSDDKDYQDILNTGILKEVNMDLLQKLALDLSEHDSEFRMKWRHFNRTFIGG